MTAFDSAILGPLFSDDEIATLLSDAALVRALVEVEIALARAEAGEGDGAFRFSHHRVGSRAA